MADYADMKAAVTAADTLEAKQAAATNASNAMRDVYKRQDHAVGDVLQQDRFTGGLGGVQTIIKEIAEVKNQLSQLNLF